MAAPRLRTTEDVVAIGRKAFTVGTCLVVGIAPRESGVETLLPVLILVLRGQVQARLLRGAQPLRLVGRCPITLIAWLAVFVDVVGVAEHRQSRVIGVVESEETSQIAVVGAQSTLDVGQQPSVVLTFQDHVHDVVLLLYLFAFPLAVVRRLVVNFHVLHRVVRQVVEHHLVVATEEILSVERQVVNLLSVDVDVAIVLQLGTWHFADKSIEHGALGQVKGRGIIDHCIATIGNLHFCSRHDNPFQVTFGKDAILFSLLLQQHTWHFELAIAGYVAHVVVDVARVIAIALGFDDEVLRMARHLELVVRVAGSPRPHEACRGIDDGRVASHQCDVCFQWSFCKRIVDSAVQTNIFLRRRVVLLLVRTSTANENNLLSLNGEYRQYGK